MVGSYCKSRNWSTTLSGATALRPCTNRRTGRIANVQQVVDECRREDAILVAVLERRADESAELLGRVELDCDIPHRFHQDDRGLAGYPTLAGDEPERRVDSRDHRRFRRGARPRPRIRT